METKNNQDVE